MGSFICWAITRDPESVKRLSGMVIIGGATDPEFLKSPFYKPRSCRSGLPMAATIRSIAAANQQAFFEKLFKSGYPARFTLFATGSHGTPVRMTDWRKVLNWIIEQRA